MLLQFSHKYCKNGACTNGSHQDFTHDEDEAPNNAEDLDV